jgi:cycloeucalenol cycloisomerase
MQLFAPNPAKARTEKLALAYSPLWISVVAAVMFSGAFKNWGEWQHMALGVGLLIPVFSIAFVPHDRERATPVWRRHAFRWATLLTLFSVIQNYFGAKLFFERFGMEYHFRTQWIANGTPVFLYPMTVAYFATYYAVMQTAYRAFSSRWPTAPRAARIAVRAALAYLMAFGETATMASPLLAGYFSYSDPRFVMIWGSFAYGTIFFVTLPLFVRLDEETPEAETRPLGAVVWDLLALNLLCLVTHEIWGALLR